MSTTFTIKNKSYHCVGRVSTIRKDENVARLEELGCASTTLVQADFVIAGTGGKKKLELARDRGTRVITQDEALEALDHEGVVELKSSDISQIIGELRSLLARPHLSDSDRWLMCASILDQCDVEQIQPVLEYVRSAFMRAVDANQTWAPRNAKHRLMNGVNSKWEQGNPGQELFVAPPAWILEMAAGEYHPKHALVRALNLDHQRLTARKLRALLGNPHLEGIHFLNFGRRAFDPGEILGELDAYEGLELREIWLYDFREALLKHLPRNKTALRKVHTIVFHGCLMRYQDEDHYGSMGDGDGRRVISEIERMSAFDERPKVVFQAIGNR